MIVSHACKTCPTLLTYDRKTAWRLHCEPCQIKRNNASKYKSLKQRRERFGRYYTPMKPTERRI